jgi:hypothetical protein
MEKIRMPSSLERNKPKDFLIFKRKSFIFAFFGVAFGFVLGRILSEIIAQLGILTPIFLGIGCFMFSEWFYRGRYPNENKENIIGYFFNKFRIKKIRIEKEKDAQYQLMNKSGSDIDSLYDLAGNEIIGFEIFRSDNKDFENVFKSSVEYLLKKLPALDQIQFIRVNKDLKDEEVYSGREILKEKRVKEQRYFIFLSLYYGLHEKYKKGCIERLKGLGKRMNRIEISNYCQSVFAPKSHPLNYELPIYPLTFFFNDKHVHAYNGDLVHAASSVASIPQIVTSDFNFFFRPIDKVDSTICVTFRGQNNVISQLKEIGGVIQNERLDEGKRSNQKKIDAYEQQKIDKDEGVDLNLSMSINIVAFGDKKDVDEALTEMENKAEEYPDTSYRPLFSRENSFLKEALFSILPGCRQFNVYRSPLIYSVIEAFCYIPMPVVQNKNKDQRAFCFRTSENTLWEFPYYKPMSTVIFGLPGSGKSLVVGRLFNHHIEMSKIGYKASGFILDLGDSFSFLEDGLADFTFKLNYDSVNCKYEPINIHPLNLFKPFGDKIKYALKFLCQIMGFDPEDTESQTSSDGKVVEIALKEFYEKKLNRLSEFMEILELKLEDFFKTISNKDAKRANWDEYKARLSNFCKGGINGEVFDPENPKFNENDLKNIHFFYACKNTQTKNDRALISAFASLVLEFGNLLEEKFKSTGGDNELSNFFYCIDELQWWRDYIPHSWLRERASQNRKFGATLWLLTQDACDLIIPKPALESGLIASEYSLLEAMQRCFFFTLPQNLNVLSILAHEPLTERGSAIPNGRIEKMQRIEKSVQEAAKKASENRNTDRVIGYCDQHMNMYSLFAEYEKSFLWASTTHDGGRAIRKKAIKHSGLPFFEVCKKLANWPDSIPENQVKESLEKDILRTAFKVDQINY